MISEISLHIGLEKTGTTSLQTFLSNSTENYIGKVTTPGFVQPLPFGKIRKAFLTQPPDFWMSNEGEKILGNINSTIRSLKGKSTVISFENFLAHDLFLSESIWLKNTKSQCWDSLDHLAQLIQSTILRDCTLNVLVTVRRQPEWFCSLYAQRSDRIPDASQSNFEFQIHRILSQETLPIPINLDLLGSAVIDRLKPNSFRFVALETLETNQGIEVLKSWLPKGNNAFSDVILPKENKRSSDENTWILRSTRFGHSKFNSLAQGLSSRFPSMSFIPSLFRRLQLSDQLKLEIMDKVSHSNARAEQFAPAGLPDYY